MSLLETSPHALVFAAICLSAILNVIDGSLGGFVQEDSESVKFTAKALRSLERLERIFRRAHDVVPAGVPGFLRILAV